MEVSMVDIRLTQNIMRDPQLRESLKSAQTPEQKIHVLEEAGFSNKEITKAAEQTADFAGTVFLGDGPCK